MTEDRAPGPEIMSFNLAELDVSALDVRLELTTIMPHVIPVCHGNCSTNGCNINCTTNSGCDCNSFECTIFS